MTIVDDNSDDNFSQSSLDVVDYFFKVTFNI